MLLSHARADVGSALPGGHELVLTTQREPNQVEVLEVAVPDRGLESEALESGLHPLGGERNPARAHQAALHRVPREEVQVGAELGRANGLHRRGSTIGGSRATAGRQKHGYGNGSHPCRPRGGPGRQIGDRHCGSSFEASGGHYAPSGLAAAIDPLECPQDQIVGRLP